MNEPRHAWPAVLAVLAFGLLSLAGGWMIVVGGGFYHTPGRRSVAAIFVDGAPALLMAGLQLLAAALAFTWLLRGVLSPVPAALWAFALVFVPAALFMLRG